MTSVPATLPLTSRIPWRKIVLYTLAILFALYLVVPFYWIVNMSFMHEVDATSVPPNFLPKDPTLANFLGFVNPSTDQALLGSNAIADTPYALVNSMVVALSTALMNLVLGTFAAYSFSRIQFRGSQVLLVAYLLTRMVPGIAIIIPFYLLMRAFDLLDTYAALILSYTTFALPITIWILKDYFRSVPRELEDAARVDRCGWFRMMWSVFCTDLRARPGCGGDLRFHDRVERVHVRALHDQHHQFTDHSGDRGQLRHRPEHPGHADVRGRGGGRGTTSGAGAGLPTVDRAGHGRRFGEGIGDG